MKNNGIIYINNKPHIKCGVVMLETKDITPLFLNTHQTKVGDMVIQHGKFHHLYITSDEEIKEGDWCYNSISNGLEKWSYKGWIEAPDFEYLGYKKVIATTDTSLGLPQPSQQFIEKFIEEYNRGNVITEVLVEVEEYEFRQIEWFQEAPYTHKYKMWKLKLDSQNQITIRKQKDNWSREEVIELCKKSYILGCNNQQTFNNNLYSEIKKKEISFIEWIEKNL